ncbi:hypothetical protein CC1G_13126 [Coprinopsis cinerea okayama7|uniref:Uncharacterized protein n=2 Tax=Coprinopsis cinerea (strain Okayama-7 / 130 / ATCC MYA-4618 / FGSC 9003) TaxID=240176 RepID=A8P077_COPC7|nr:hypothetical protein CC1G_13126 [Coprinopsis cinerea okayama7\|eukprot:XP_001837831.2 hypothetical protein CC1G_13126 [Coprinopsis cinerea okayama7\
MSGGAMDTDEVADDVRFVPFTEDPESAPALLEDDNAGWRTFSTQEAEGPPGSQSPTPKPAYTDLDEGGKMEVEGSGLKGKGKGKEKGNAWSPFSDEAEALKWFADLPEHQAATLFSGYFSDNIATSGRPHREIFPKNSDFPLASDLKSARGPAATSSEAGASKAGAPVNEQMDGILKGLLDTMPESIRNEIVSDESQLIWNLPNLEDAGMSADLIDAQLNYMSSWLGTLVNHYMHNCEVYDRLESHLKSVKASMVLREQSIALTESLKGLGSLVES